MPRGGKAYAIAFFVTLWTKDRKAYTMGVCCRTDFETDDSTLLPNLA